MSRRLRSHRPPRAGMRLVLLAAGLLLAPCAASQEVETSPPSCPPEPQVLAGSGARALVLRLPAPLVSWAFPRLGDGAREAILLLTPPETDPEEEVLKAILRRARDSGELAEILAADPHIRFDPDKPGAVDGVLKAMGIVLDDEPAGPCPGEEAPAAPALFRLAGEGGSRIEPLPIALPEETEAILGLDLDGDGRDELLAQAGDGLFRLAGEGGEPELVLRDPDLGVRAEEPENVSFPAEPLAVRSPLDDLGRVESRRDLPGALLAPTAAPPLHLRVAGFGELRLYGPTGGMGGPWDLRSRVELPTRSNPDDIQLLLASPQTRTVGRDRDGHLVLAAGPVPYGDRRLRTVVIDLVGLDEPTSRDTWSRLDDGEEIVESGFFMLDAEPLMWLRTDNERRGGIFGDNERLLFFRLSSDRSRAGLDPVRIEEKIKPFLRGRIRQGRDVDGDGRDDLLVVGRDDGIVLSAVLQDDEGRLRGSWRQQRLTAGDRPLSYGDDVNGDGRADLVGRQGPELQFYLGLTPERDGGHLRLLDETPAWSVRLVRPLPEAAIRQLESAELRKTLKELGAPPIKEVPTEQEVPCHDAAAVLVDLDGDGLKEWLCPGQEDSTRPWLTTVRLSPPPAAPAR